MKKVKAKIEEHYLCYLNDNYQLKISFDQDATYEGLFGISNTVFLLTNNKYYPVKHDDIDLDTFMAMSNHDYEIGFPLYTSMYPDEDGLYFTLEKGTPWTRCDGIVIAPTKKQAEELCDQYNTFFTAERQKNLWKMEILIKKDCLSCGGHAYESVTTVHNFINKHPETNGMLDELNAMRKDVLDDGKKFYIVEEEEILTTDKLKKSIMELKNQLLDDKYYDIRHIIRSLDFHSLSIAKTEEEIESILNQNYKWSGYKWDKETVIKNKLINIINSLV